jgi:hypothetical protein
MGSALLVCAGALPADAQTPVFGSAETGDSSETEGEPSLVVTRRYG